MTAKSRVRITTYLILMLARNFVVWGKDIFLLGKLHYFRNSPAEINLFASLQVYEKIGTFDILEYRTYVTSGIQNSYMILSISSNKVMLNKTRIATVSQAKILKPRLLVCSPMIFLLLIKTSMKTRITGSTIPFTT